jgi:hypothetical protein
LRPGCTACASGAHREAAIIDHPGGEETQFDWLELPDPPAGWGLGGPAHLLVGSLAHSSRWRAVLAESEDQPHLIEALDGVVRRLGGVSRYWRFDRMATVCHPASGRVSSSFAAVAGHYSAGVRICPPRRGQRKGVVEKANHSAAQRWWRALADELSPTAAQADLDRFCVRVGDARTRRDADGERVTVAQLAATEPLQPVPIAPYPAAVSVTRTVSAQALVAFRGNTYSVPPGMAGRELIVSARLGAAHLEVATPGSGEAGAVLARHLLAPPGAGAVVRDAGHVTALEHAVLAAFSDRAPDEDCGAGDERGELEGRARHLAVEGADRVYGGRERHVARQRRPRPGPRDHHRNQNSERHQSAPGVPGAALSALRSPARAGTVGVRPPPRAPSAEARVTFGRQNRRNTNSAPKHTRDPMTSGRYGPRNCEVGSCPAM